MSKSLKAYGLDREGIALPDIDREFAKNSTRDGFPPVIIVLLVNVEGIVTSDNELVMLT